MASESPRGEAAGYYHQQQQEQPRRGGYNGTDGASWGSLPPAPPYAPQPDPSYGYGGPGQMSEKPTFDQVFRVERPKWNDLWAGVLFLLFVAGFTAVSGYAIHGYSQVKGLNGGLNGGSNAFGLTTSTLFLFGWVLITSIVLGFIYIWLARMFTKQFIWLTGILNIGMFMASAIYMLYRGYYAGGVVFLIFGVLFILAFITWIPRIPFSVLMLRTAIDVARNYGHVYLVSALGGFLGTVVSAWFLVTLVALYVRFEPSDNNPFCRNGNCSSATVAGLIFFVTFTMYWMTEWIKNTIHTTISGVYGAWYFNPHNLPTGATRGALKRSLTYSFGSISLGSLIVAVIQFLRQICSMAQQQSASEGNIVGYIMFCILGCLISILDWAVQFINKYAFSHIALYGKAYIPAAKDTWRMIKDRGVDALINDCLVDPVLSMGGLFVGAVTAFLAFLYLLFTHPAYNSTGSYTIVIVGFSFAVGLQICNIFTTAIASGITTIFVAAAWDPEVMMRKHPDLYAQMVQVYPHVQQAIHA